jgi:hypothetical protein
VEDHLATIEGGVDYTCVTAVGLNELYALAPTVEPHHLVTFRRQHAAQSSAM